MQPHNFNQRLSMDIYFITPAGELCPEGCFPYACDCGPMCYTFLRPAFDVWYHNTQYPALPPKRLSDELERRMLEAGRDTDCRRPLSGCA